MAEKVINKRVNKCCECCDFIYIFVAEVISALLRIGEITTTKAIIVSRHISGHP